MACRMRLPLPPFPFQEGLKELVVIVSKTEDYRPIGSMVMNWSVGLSS